MPAVCRKPFRTNDATVLIDLVTSFLVVMDKPEVPTTTVRVHLCEPCAHPIILHKQKAVEDFCSALAEMLAKQVLEEVKTERA